MQETEKVENAEFDESAMDPHVKANQDNQLVTIEKKHLDDLYFNIYSLQDRLRSLEETVAQNQVENEKKMNEMLTKLSSLKPKQQQPNEQSKKKKKSKMNKSAHPDTRYPDKQSSIICTDDGSQWRRKKPSPASKSQNRENVREKPITALSQFSAKTQSSCKKIGISEFNQVQKQIMPDLCAGKDLFIVSPPATGKTTAIILANVNKLNESAKTSLSLFLTIDSAHATYLRAQCEKIGGNFPNIQISPKQNKQKTKAKMNGRRIHICTAGKAINFLQNMFSGSSNHNLQSIVVFDADALFVDSNLLDKVMKIFACIPEQCAENVSLQIVANSYSSKMEKSVKNILHDRYQSFQNHVFSFNDDHFKFWKLTINGTKKRMTALERILQQNPFGCGIINCQNLKTAKLIHQQINEKYGSYVLNANYVNEMKKAVETFNDGNISYLICHKFSPKTYITQCVAYDKLQMIINYEVKVTESFLRRCTVRKYKKKENDLHIVTLFDANEAKTITEIEEDTRKKMQAFDSGMWSATHKSKDKTSMSSSPVPTPMQKRRSSSPKRKSALNPFVAEFKPTSPKKGQDSLFEPLTVPSPSNDKNNARLLRYSGTKRTLFGLIDEYLQNGNMDKIISLKCSDMKIWGNVINDTLRDKDRPEIKMFNNLIIALFNCGMLQKGETFQLSILKYLVMMVDISVRQNPYFAQSLGELLAILCHFKHCHPNDCYGCFCKWYKEYSDNNKRAQKELIHAFILSSLQELERLHASQKLISQVSKLLK